MWLEKKKERTRCTWTATNEKWNWKIGNQRVAAAAAAAEEEEEEGNEEERKNTFQAN